METTATLSPAQGKSSDAVRYGTDWYIWGTYIFLAVISIVELFSASSQEVQVNDIYGPILRHAMFLGIGLVLMLAIQRIHFLRLYYMIPLFVLASIVLMVWVLVGGININGVRRAVRIAGMLVLPAEFLKLAVALGIAWILSRCQIRTPSGGHDVATRGVVASACLVLLSSALLFNQGLTNTLLLMGISMAMMLVGGISWKKFGIVLVVYGVIAGAAIGVKALSAQDKGPTPEDIELARINQTEVVSTADKKNRFHTWKARMERHFRLNKSTDVIDDENKQEQLSYIAQARGGWRGVGIGNSRENARLPLAFSDYIFAIIVEELGAVIAIAIMVFYLFLLGRAGRLAMQFKSTLPTLLVIGCALVICMQALFHISIVVGLFPVSGQPLPLISKGGTSIIATSLALGVMLSASQWAARKSDETAVKQELSTLPEKIATDNPSQL